MVFVAMPFGKKRDAKGVEIDFDAIYEKGIQPAVAGLNVELLRADEERGGGIVHLPMFERLLIAEIAIVDVTVENANVFYELGVRHTACPRSTIIIRARGVQMPFDIRLIRAETYALDNGLLSDASAKALSTALAQRLAEAIGELDDKSDSPLFQLIPAYKKIDLPHAVTENFRDRAKNVNAIRDRLALARGLKKDPAIKAIRGIEDELGAISSFNAESAVDVMLSYRDVEAFDRMITFIDKFPPPLLENNQVIREQYALALNRRAKPGDRERARDMLLAIIEARGDSPETCGLLGRIYKDYYKGAKDDFTARAYLDECIDWYRRGFTADPRDFYPGINLLTMLVASVCARTPRRDKFTRLLDACDRARSSGSRQRLADRATRHAEARDGRSKASAVKNNARQPRDYLKGRAAVHYGFRTRRSHCQLCGARRGSGSEEAA